jgi:hypothetical protein
MKIANVSQISVIHYEIFLKSYLWSLVLGSYQLQIIFSAIYLGVTRFMYIFGASMDEIDDQVLFANDVCAVQRSPLHGRG